MRVIFLVVACTVICAALLWRNYSNIAGSRRSVIQAERVGGVDFGLQIGDTTATREFRLQNTSTVPWRVDRFWADCGCVEVKDVSPSVPADGFFSCLITINTRSFNGHQSKTIYVDTEPQGVLAIGVTVDIADDIRVEPEELRVSLARGASEFDEVVNVFVPAAGEFIALTPSEHDGLDVTVGAPARSDLYYVIPCRLRGQTLGQQERWWNQAFRAQLTTGSREVTCPVVAYRYAPIRVSPAIIILTEGTNPHRLALHVQGDGLGEGPLACRLNPPTLGTVVVSEGEGTVMVSLTEASPGEVIVSCGSNSASIPIYTNIALSR